MRIQDEWLEEADDDACACDVRDAYPYRGQKHNPGAGGGWNSAGGPLKICARRRQSAASVLPSWKHEALAVKEIRPVDA